MIQFIYTLRMTRFFQNKLISEITNRKTNYLNFAIYFESLNFVSLDLQIYICFWSKFIYIIFIPGQIRIIQPTFAIGKKRLSFHKSSFFTFNWDALFLILLGRTFSLNILARFPCNCSIA